MPIYTRKKQFVMWWVWELRSVPHIRDEISRRRAGVVRLWLFEHIALSLILVLRLSSSRELGKPRDGTQGYPGSALARVIMLSRACCVLENAIELWKIFSFFCSPLAAKRVFAHCCFARLLFRRGVRFFFVYGLAWLLEFRAIKMLFVYTGS